METEGSPLGKVWVLYTFSVFLFMPYPGYTSCCSWPNAPEPLCTARRTLWKHRQTACFEGTQSVKEFKKIWKQQWIAMTHIHAFRSGIIVAFTQTMGKPWKESGWKKLSGKPFNFSSAKKSTHMALWPPGEMRAEPFARGFKQGSFLGLVRSTYSRAHL